MTSSSVSSGGSSRGIPGQNLLGLTLAFDNNLVGSDLRAVRYLRHLHLVGCIAVVVSDDVDNELDKASDDKYADLTEDAFPYRRNHGVGVIGYSRLGSFVLGGDDDEELMDEIRSILKPGIDDWSTASENDVFDAKHVHTAIRSSADAFVTLDSGILKRADRLKSHIEVWTPGRAAVVARKRRRNHRIRERARKRHDV